MVTREGADPGEVVSAYDRAARWYDAWDWQTFWDLNEVPRAMAACAELCQGRRALDAGAGTGRYVSALRKAGFHVTGVDLSTGMLAAAAVKLGSSEELVNADIRSLPFPHASFDLAVAARVLGHIPEIETALAEIARVVVPGGVLLISDLDPEHAFDKTRIWTPEGTIVVPFAKRTPQELVQLAESVGWRQAKVKRVCATECQWLPPRERIRSIDLSGARAVFFLLTLVRA